MATTYTPNYHLGKQEDRSDKFVMKVITDNMDVIDEQLKATDDKATAAAAGLKYKGAVNYYNDLPNDAEIGDAYTVLYAGSSGTVPDGTEYVWGELNGTAQWIDFSKDTYTKAEVDALLAAKQALLNMNNKLDPAYINYDSSHRAVSDTEKASWNGKQSALSTAQLAAVNSGIDSTKVAQIEANKNNISKLTPIDGDITWNTSAIGSEPSINTKYIMQQGNIVNIQLYIEFATALTENTETVIGTLTGVIFPKNIYRGVAMQGADYYSSVLTPCYIAIGTTGNVAIKPPTGATNKKYLINITYHNQ